MLNGLNLNVVDSLMSTLIIFKIIYNLINKKL